MAVDLTIAAPSAPLINDKLSFIAGRISQLSSSGALPLSALTGIRLFRLQLSPAAVAANTTVEQTFPAASIPGGALVLVNKPSAQAGLGIVGSRAAAAGSLGVTFSNVTGAPITPTAKETYLVAALSF